LKAIVFGAGNIGRGFLGSLLAKAGFFVTFIDVDENKISLINRQKEYPVFVVSGKGIQEEVVRGIGAISLADTSSITEAIIESDVVLTAVGKDPLAAVAVCLARGLAERIKKRPQSEVHIVVVACENIQDNTAYLKNLILAQVSQKNKARIESLISFPNCVVDRIVPNTLPENGRSNLLAVAVEEYFQLAIDVAGLKAPFPVIPGIDMSQNLAATLEQKLFTLNMAHAIVGYYGYLKGYHFIHEAVDDLDIKELLRGAILEVSATITSRHPTISADSQRKYAQKVVSRFQNSYLQDELVRVARQPKRKLGPQDRLVHPAILTWEQGRVPSYLATGITAALHFNYDGDSQARELSGEIRQKGIERVLQEVSGLAPSSEIAQLVKADFLFRAL
jgi:mannitol-1-phosphate 5-dehydrogenase